MSTSLIPDPFQLWREALTKLEGNVNSLVTGGMDSQELMRSVHQLSSLSMGMQQAFEKAIGSYLAKVNLPSRKDVHDLAATLQRVEDKLDRLLPAAAVSAAPRPPRTRRPQEDAAPAAEAAAAATPALAKPATVESAPAKRASATRTTAKRAPAKPARASKGAASRGRRRS